MDAEQTKVRRPAGAAVLQEDVTAAIRLAVFAELAERGFAALSMESVARRAAVGKTALYRRWSNKQQMIGELVSEVAIHELDMPDTGTLRGDVSAFLRAMAAVLAHPMVSAIVPDLLGEANRNPGLAETLLRTVRDPRRERAAAVIHRGIERGELNPDIDVELALDLLAGPLYWRTAIIRSPLSPSQLDQLCEAVLAALTHMGSNGH
jgi:AcrR family transcriptional regulator